MLQVSKEGEKMSNSKHNKTYQIWSPASLERIAAAISGKESKVSCLLCSSVPNQRRTLCEKHKQCEAVFSSQEAAKDIYSKCRLVEIAKTIEVSCSEVKE